MSGLPDPSHSRAVLIGTSRFAKLEQLPAVRNNLWMLAKLLRDDRTWGLPAEHCVVIEDPVSSGDMLDPVQNAADECTDTLLVYYAGHGLVDSRKGEFHLALVGSDHERIYTAVSYGHVRDALLDSRASRRIVVLDCCYSGRALGLMGGDRVSAAVEEATVEGTYMMAAAAETKRALAEPGEDYTAFTAELLAILSNGIPGCGKLLDVDAIFNEIRDNMRAKSRPMPQKRDRNTAGQLTLIRNRAHRLTLIRNRGRHGRHSMAPPIDAQAFDADRKAREDAEQRVHQEQAREAREDAEQRVHQERIRKAREDAEQRVHEEQIRKAREDAEQREREERIRKARETSTAMR